MGSTMPELMGERIAAGRAMRGWSQDELARRSGLDLALIAGFEAGEEPSYDAFRRVASALRLPYEWFLPG
jgi:transcriptional regulator with XRE-family HTH domain